MMDDVGGVVSFFIAEFKKLKLCVGSEVECG